MSTHKELIKFIDHLIMSCSEYNGDGYSLKWGNIDECDQQHIAALMLEDDDRDLFSVYQNDNYEHIVSSLIVYLKNDAKETERSFARCLRNNLVNYYEKRAQEMIDERVQHLGAEMRHEHGKFRFQDRNTGEFYNYSI